MIQLYPSTSVALQSPSNLPLSGRLLQVQPSSAELCWTYIPAIMAQRAAHDRNSGTGVIPFALCLSDRTTGMDVLPFAPAFLTAPVYFKSRKRQIVPKSLRFAKRWTRPGAKLKLGAWRLKWKDDRRRGIAASFGSGGHNGESVSASRAERHRYGWRMRTG